MRIFGVGELARVMYSYLVLDYKVGRLLSVPDRATVHKEFLVENVWWAPELQVEPFEEATGRPNLIYIPVGYGDMNRHRERVFKEAHEKKLRIMRHVHFKAEIAHDATTSIGCWIQEHCNVQSGALLRQGVTMWASSHVGHGSEIGEFCWITTHATICGNTKLGKNCFVGANAVVGPNLNIAPFTLIGSGAIVTKDTQEGDVFVAGQNNRIDKKSWEITLK